MSKRVTVHQLRAISIVLTIQMQQQNILMAAHCTYYLPSIRFRYIVFDDFSSTINVSFIYFSLCSLPGSNNGQSLNKWQIHCKFWRLVVALPIAIRNAMYSWAINCKNFSILRQLQPFGVMKVLMIMLLLLLLHLYWYMHSFDRINLTAILLFFCCKLHISHMHRNRYAQSILICFL